MFAMTSRLAILAFVLCQVSSAMAAEHTYPGSMCVKATGVSGNRGVPRINHLGEMLNASTTGDSLIVVCPVVGPYNDLSGTVPDNSADVFVHDTSDSADVCCTARANNVGALTSGPTVCSSETDTRYQRLRLQTPVVNFTFTSRSFLCVIPAGSSIRLYRY